MSNAQLNFRVAMAAARGGIAVAKRHIAEATTREQSAAAQAELEHAEAEVKWLLGRGPRPIKR